MADEPEDPPIGTAQNAADVARKAERDEADRQETIAQLLGYAHSKFPWSKEDLERAYNRLTKNCITSEAPSLDDFTAAVADLVLRSGDARS